MIRSNMVIFALFGAATLLSTAMAQAAIVLARPGDNLQRLVNGLRRGDELVLADGTYPDTSIDFGSLSSITFRAEKVVPVTITRDDNGSPVARGGGVILNSRGKSFALRGGTDITVRGITVDGCSNAIQKSAIQCRSGWKLEDVIVQRVDTSGVSIDGGDDINRRAQNISMSRVVAQDNGYIGIGGGFAQHVRLTDCASFRNNRGWHANAFGEQGYQKNGKWFAHAQWEAGGGKFAVCDDVVITRHWAEANNGPGLWFDWKNTNIVVRDSMFLNQTFSEFDYDGLGMQVEINDGPILIENCLFQGNVGAINVAEDHKVTIRNCHLVESIWTRNLGEKLGLRNDGVQDLTVTGNTFYGDAHVMLWKNMDDEYNRKNRIVLAPNTVNATLPVTWKVDGLPTPPPPKGMPAPINVHGQINDGIGVTNGWGPVEINRSVGEEAPGDGLPMKVAGQRFERGFGVHAPFTATYLLDGKSGTFRTKVGIDDEVSGGSAALVVLLDGQKAAEVAVRSGEHAKDVVLDVAGKTKLTLSVTDGGDGKENDHVDLIDPRIE
jgi:hypothetical protein